MNLLLAEASELSTEGILWLDDRRADHLRKVLKVEVGQRLKVGILGGRQGSAEVISVGEKIQLAVPLELAQAAEPAAEPSLDVVLALPRPQALHRVLQSVATMGVRRLDLVRSWRVEKSFFHSPSLSEASIRKHLWLGAEQGMVTRLPEVRIYPVLRPFLDLLAAEETARTLRLLTHPEASKDLEEVWQGHVEAEGPQRLQVAIGPEGGWIDREVESLEALGFHGVRLGPWILKVENALTAVLAQLDLLQRSAQGPGSRSNGSSG